MKIYIHQRLTARGKNSRKGKERDKYAKNTIGFKKLKL